jgi:hypothetical protein
LLEENVACRAHLDEPTDRRAHSESDDEDDDEDDNEVQRPPFTSTLSLP